MPIGPGMAHSLEIRVPFVDVKLFSALASSVVSDHYPTKSDVASVLASPLSSLIANRPKTGFMTPLKEWAAAATGGSTGERGLRSWSRCVLSRVSGSSRAGSEVSASDSRVPSVQYHAPVYRALQTQFRVPVTAIYGSDMGVAGYRDREFGVSLAWDTDLLSGYDSHFLARCDGMGRAAGRNTGAGGRRVLCEAQTAGGDAGRLRLAFRPGGLVRGMAHRIAAAVRGETTDHSVSRTPARAWMRDTACVLSTGGCSALL